MNIESFTEPDQHPFDMLRGYQHASEKEHALAAMLCKCIEAGSLGIRHDFTGPIADEMVSDGLLLDGVFTKKALGLLYSVYGA